MAKGVIYILTNPSFPEYVKIGFATDLEERIRQLNSSTAVPFSFHATAYYEDVEELTDRNLHALIDKFNPSLRAREETNDGRTRQREFFRMSPEDAYEILDAIATITGTKNRLHLVPATVEQQAEEEAANEDREAARRSSFTFSSCGIKPGEKVYFKNDNSKVVTVVDDHHVQYEDRVTFLSTLAREWLGCEAVQGPRYFLYKGEILDDLRRRRERESLG